MKPEDLRIGNYVYVPIIQKKAVVYFLGPTGIITANDDGIGPFNLTMDAIEPITLTFEAHELYLKKLLYQDLGLPEIKYVYDLQNLYYFLRKVELEIQK